MKIDGISLPKTSGRLLAIKNEAICLKGNCIADIGADHGYLAVMLAKSGLFEKVVATDISAPSLKKTEKLAAKLNLKIDCRVGDGLLVASDADVACICGMGGYEIIKILQQNSNCRQFVMQPVQNTIELRQFLYQNGFNVTKDYTILDHNKFYNIIVASGKYTGNGAVKITKKLQQEIYFGKTNLDQMSNDFKKYLLSQAKKLNFLENFDKTITSDIQQKINYYNNIKRLIKKENL